MGISFTMVLPITAIPLGVLIEGVHTSWKVWVSFIALDLFFIASFAYMYFWFRKRGSRQPRGIDPYVINCSTYNSYWYSIDDIGALNRIKKYDFGYYGRCLTDRDYRLYVFSFPVYNEEYYDSLHNEALEAIKAPPATVHQWAIINLLVIENWSEEAEEAAQINAGNRLLYNGLLEVFVDLQNNRVLIPKCIFDNYGAVSKYLCCVTYIFKFLFGDSSTE